MPGTAKSVLLAFGQWRRGAGPWRDLVRDGSEAQLPQRVRARIADEDAASERLVGWVQLALAGGLAVLYGLARRPDDAAALMLSPVPWVLAVYAAFTGLKLAISHVRPLPGALIILSIVADVALLVGLVWLFHGQYLEPPAFSLKVPTFVYLFVLVALRALRFDVRYVLTAGCVAAGGWIALTLAAIWASPPGTVTRNFSRYILDNAILVGAEVDKVMAILAMTLVLAAGVRRAKRLLVTAVAEEAAGREVRRYLSRGVAEAIVQSERVREAGEATHRAAAIVMLDVRGFTALTARLPAPEVVRILTSLHARIVPIIRRHGGVVDKFLGDGVMATFGVVEASSTAAADALRALDAIMVEAEHWRLGLLQSGMPSASAPSVNGALAAGDVVAAILGDDQRLELTVIGEAANVAAKLEKHNKLLGSRALATADAWLLAAAQGYVGGAAERRREQVMLAGVSGLVEVVVVA